MGDLEAAAAVVVADIRMKAELEEERDAVDGSCCKQVALAQENTVVHSRKAEQGILASEEFAAEDHMLA